MTKIEEIKQKLEEIRRKELKKYTEIPKKKIKKEQKKK